MPWKERTRMDEKLFFIRDYEAGCFTVTYLAKEYNISRKTAYKYIKRFKEEGLDGLQNKSSRPHRSPNKVSKEIEREILKQKKKDRFFGARKIKNKLEEKVGSDCPAKSTIHNVLKRHGHTNAPKRRRRLRPLNVIHEANEPNDIWTSDYKGDFLTLDRKRCYPLTVVDMYSRFIIGIKCMPSTNYLDAKSYYIALFREYGLPRQMLCDNGSPFAAPQALARLTRLSAWWIRLGILPVYIDPGSPWQNGKHERMHRELKMETTKPPAKNISGQQIKSTNFRKKYNTYRPHEAWDDDKPVNHYSRSLREYPERIEPYVYPDHFILKNVTKNGAFRWPGDKWVYVSTSIPNQYVGLEELDDGFYCVWYCNVKLGYLDESKLRIEDDLGRLKRNML